MNNRQSSGGAPREDAQRVQMERLIRLAGKSLGQDEKQVRAAMESGSAEQLARALPPEQAERLRQVLSSPEETKRLLSSSRAKRLFEMLGGK